MLSAIRSTAVLASVFLFLAAPADAIDYVYDDLDRLTEVHYDDGTVVTYTYDAGGNRLSRDVSEDRDGDGIPYSGGASFCAGGSTTGCEDNCPTIANPTQDDQDGDGVGDACDNCVSTANPRPPGSDAAGFTGNQADADEDGHGNACDGDFNDDGFSGGPDFDAFLQCFNRSTGSPGPPADPSCQESDMNGDGFVGGPDFDLFLQLFNGAPGPKCTSCPLENLL